MRKVYKILTSLLLLFFFCRLSAQQEKFKAVFIFNFTKYIEWSPADKQGDFIIGVIGSTEITKHLISVAQKMKVGNQPIVVKQYRSVEEVDRCHLLYISPDKSVELNKAILKFVNKNTLIITDKNGLIKQGSGINFYSDEGELKFEVSKNNIEKTGLKINPALLILGKST